MILRRKRDLQFMNEVDVDGAPAGDETVEDPDYTAGEENPPVDNSVIRADDPPPTDDRNYTGGDDDIDYTQDSGNPGIEGEENEDGGRNPPAEDDQVTADDARGMEQELFQDLTTDQIDIKHKELKSKFLELYNSTSNIVDRVNEIPTSDNTIASITFVAKKLSELRKMIADYMNDVYSTKSYMENSINYNRFIAALNGINKILNEINEELVNKDHNEANR